MNNFKNNYDLEERTAKFGEEVIEFCRNAKRDPIILPVLTQLVRSATSIGANYMEANGASSQKDFANKIYISKKESQETKHWLRMLASYYPTEKEKLRNFWQEAQEFTLIFHKIVSTINIKNSLKSEK
jgi:four helix bundle protein